MDYFVLSFILVFFLSLVSLIIVTIIMSIKNQELQKEIFDFKKYLMIIDVKRKKINIKVFGDKSNLFWLKNLSIKKFLNNFSYESHFSKSIFDLLKNIDNFKIKGNAHKEILKKWDYFERDFFFYSIDKTIFGRHILCNLRVDLYVEEEDIVYAHGNFINFQKLNIEKIFSQKKINIIEHSKLLETIQKDIKIKSLNKHFLINIFDKNINEYFNEINDFKYIIFYMFAIWLNENKYENVYFTDKYNIFIFTNKHLYKDVYLNNRYWYEKINILYEEFLEDYKIKGRYNKISSTSSYEFNNTKKSNTIALINFNILQDLIKNNKDIEYLYVKEAAEKIYEFENNFKKIKINELISQKEFKGKDKYILLSLNLNLNTNISLKLKYFSNIKLVYQYFFNEVYKIVSKNKGKFYRVIIPIKIYDSIDFKRFLDLINIKIYLEAFQNKSQYLNYKDYLSSIDLNNKRFGIYVDEIKYAWDIIKATKPRNLWLSNRIFKNEKFSLEIEYFFEKIKYYSVGEKIILEGN